MWGKTSLYVSDYPEIHFILRDINTVLKVNYSKLAPISLFGKHTTPSYAKLDLIFSSMEIKRPEDVKDLVLQIGYYIRKTKEEVVLLYGEDVYIIIWGSLFLNGEFLFGHLMHIDKISNDVEYYSADLYVSKKILESKKAICQYLVDDLKKDEYFIEEGKVIEENIPSIEVLHSSIKGVTIYRPIKVREDLKEVIKEDILKKKEALGSIYDYDALFKIINFNN